MCVLPRRDILDTGSTLIIVKDTTGHVFGGFANENWKQDPNFFGTAACFLFRLRPDMYICRPSGLNENFM